MPLNAAAKNTSRPAASLVVPTFDPSIVATVDPAQTKPRHNTRPVTGCQVEIAEKENQKPKKNGKWDSDARNRLSFPHFYRH